MTARLSGLGVIPVEKFDHSSMMGGVTYIRGRPPNPSIAGRQLLEACREPQRHLHIRWSSRAQSPTCCARRRDYRDRRSPCVCVRHSIHDCASVNARCEPGPAQNPLGTLRARALKNHKIESTWSQYKQVSIKSTFLALSLEKIYTCTRVLFGIVLDPVMRPSDLRISHAGPGFRFGWGNSIAVSMQRPCSSFGARRSDSRE